MIWILLLLLLLSAWAACGWAGWYLDRLACRIWRIEMDGDDPAWFLLNLFLGPLSAAGGLRLYREAIRDRNRF